MNETIDHRVAFGPTMNAMGTSGRTSIATPLRDRAGETPAMAWEEHGWALTGGQVATVLGLIGLVSGLCAVAG